MFFLIVSYVKIPGHNNGIKQYRSTKQPLRFWHFEFAVFEVYIYIYMCENKQMKILLKKLNHKYKA